MRDSFLSFVSRKVKLVYLAFQAVKVYQAHRVQWAKMVSCSSNCTRRKPPFVSQAFRVLRVCQVLQASRDAMDSRVAMVLQAFQVIVASLACQANQVSEARRVR